MSRHVNISGPDDVIAGQDPVEPALPPDLALDQVVDVGQSLLSQAEVFLYSLFRTWNLYQVLIAIGLFTLAHLLRVVLGPRIRTWMASRENWPKWRMRVLVVIHQRLRPIFFVILIWSVIFVMREMTWPSRSYLLGVIGTLALAWLTVVFLTRLIKSTFLRKFVRYGAWTYATLYILGLVEEAEQLLNSLGFSIGDFRISMLLVVQAIVIIGVLATLARMITTSTASRIRQNEDISPSMQVLIVKIMQIAFYAAAFFIGVRAVRYKRGSRTRRCFHNRRGRGNRRATRTTGTDTHFRDSFNATARNNHGGTTGYQGNF